MNKIQTLAEYQQLAARTCPDLGSFDANVYHMELGIITEIGECLDIFKKKHAYAKSIDKVHLSEEIADICWYVANNARIQFPSLILDTEMEKAELNLKAFLQYVKPESLIPQTVSLLQALLTLFGVVNSSETVLAYIANPPATFALLQHICEVEEIDFWQALTNNIAKLQQRYPEKFTNGAALNRNLEAERSKLEVNMTSVNLVESTLQTMEEIKEVGTTLHIVKDEEPTEQQDPGDEN